MGDRVVPAARYWRAFARLRELGELHKKIGRHFTVAKELKQCLQSEPEVPARTSGRQVLLRCRVVQCSS